MVQTAPNRDASTNATDGKIDIEEANKEWFINTDPAKSHKADPLFDGGAETGKQNFSTFQQAKTADIYYRAMFTKAKPAKMITGETIDRKKAGHHAFNLGRSLRDLFLSFSVRYGAQVAADLGTDEHKTVVVLDEYIRKLLAESGELISREL